MKKTLLYLILFTYAASILKPAMPYISDAVAHTFYYAEHLKTVHYENGKYHVHYELVRQAQKNTSSENPGQIKKGSLPDEHLITSFSLALINSPLHNTYSLLLPNIIIPVCRNTVFSPPRC